MYTKNIPFKDFKNKPHTSAVQFNLTETEVFKLIGELKAVFDWLDSMQGEERTITTEETQKFYTDFEDLLLEAWGEMSDDGMHFRKGGRYDFAESALFNATMLYFLTNPEETTALLEGILPDGMEELARQADEKLVQAGKAAGTDAQQAEIDRLRAELAAKTSE